VGVLLLDKLKEKPVLKQKHNSNIWRTSYGHPNHHIYQT
jgi:hypothetical protein